MTSLDRYTAYKELSRAIEENENPFDCHFEILSPNRVRAMQVAVDALLNVEQLETCYAKKGDRGFKSFFNRLFMGGL